MTIEPKKKQTFEAVCQTDPMTLSTALPAPPPVTSMSSSKPGATEPLKIETGI